MLVSLVLYVLAIDLNLTKLNFLTIKVDKYILMCVLKITVNINLVIRVLNNHVLRSNMFSNNIFI